MKKTAVKGLAALGIIVLLCVFFSGTLHTITTAKVKFAKARTGRLEIRVTMTGSLQWPETENLTVEGMTDDDALSVRRYTVSAGSWVKEGDLIAQCTVNNYESRLQGLRDSYSAKEKEYLEQERKNASLVLTDQQKNWYEAYRRLQETRGAVQLLRQDLRLEAWKAGVSLEEGDRLPEGCGDETLKELGGKLSDAEKEEAAAQQAFDRMRMLNISEDIVAYLDKKEELQSEMESLSGQMTALRILNERAAAIRAPHAGYITEAELKAGDQVTADTLLAVITAADAEPVIRLDPGDSKLTVAAGTAVSLSAGDNSADSKIVGQGVTPDGSPYLDAEVSRKILSRLGGAAAVSEEGSVTATLTCQAENSSTLIPVSALRGTAGDYYIYTAATSMTTLGAEKYTVSKKNVTVLGMNGTAASIEESLKSESIVYMEDRPLSEGLEVMPYDEKQ